MGLIDLQTDLKSLKFGKDRFGGGDSGQPYIKTPIITEPGKLSQSDDDFLFRGGTRTPVRALEDVARLTKYLANPKNPSGFLFGVKQNLLSRTAVKTESSFGAGYAAGALNEGIYTPLSTLAQAGVGFTGVHLNKQGLDPTGLISSISLNKYESVIKNQTLDNFQTSNRLVALTNAIKENVEVNEFNSQKGYSLNTNGNIFLYGGGPGSILGFGKTEIKFADQRTGKDNPLSISNPKFFYSGSLDKDKTTIKTSGVLASKETSSTLNPEFKGLTNEKIGLSEDNIFQLKSAYVYDGKGKIKPISSSLDISQLANEDEHKIKKQTSPGGNKKTGLPVYKTKTTDARFEDIELENRVNLGDPGKSKGSTKVIMDKINASPVYITDKSSGKAGTTNPDFNDFAHFRIGIINPQNPTQTTYMNFRAFIDGFSDSYNTDWKSQQYMGRGEKFYKYQAFERDISLSFTVVAQSQAEIYGMYQKLNALASSLAPTYTEAGYMAGNIAKLTVGDYIWEQPGFISNLTYDVPQDSSWEITIGKGASIKDELPFMIKVTGLKFTPIHDFRPEFNKGKVDGRIGRFITKDLLFPRIPNETTVTPNEEDLPTEVEDETPVEDLLPSFDFTNPSAEDFFVYPTDKTYVDNSLYNKFPTPDLSKF